MSMKYKVGDKVTTSDFSGICTIKQVGSISIISRERLYVVRNNLGSELVEHESNIKPAKMTNVKKGEAR